MHVPYCMVDRLGGAHYDWHALIYLLPLPVQEGVRPYTTNTPHGYHSDNSDIAALLCMRDAEEGGVNNWTSSIAVHNALLRRGRKV